MLDYEVIAQIHALEEPEEPSLLAELIEAFRGSAPGHIACLQAALAVGDATAVEDAAHALKGGAASLGAVRLRRVAYDWSFARDHNLMQAEQQVIALEAAFIRALEALTQEDARSRQT